MSTLRLTFRAGALLVVMGVSMSAGSIIVGIAYPLWDLLAFSQIINGQSDLFLADSTGRVVNLTRTPRASEVHPAWSPDGDHIAYVSNATYNEELYIIQPFTGTIEQITSTNSSHALPSWSPDGDAIAIAFINNAVLNQSDVFTLDLATGVRRNLTEVGNSNILEGTLPKWSPNGEYLAFVNEGRRAIYIAQLPYGEIITHSTGLTQHPAWAPDGEQLVYVGPRSRFTASIADTLFIHDLTAPDEPPLAFPMDFQGIASPVWAPDGETIAFIGQAFDNTTSSRFFQYSMDIYLFDMTTGDFHRISDVGTTINIGTLDWSPDGSRVAFQTNDQHQGNQLCIQWVDQMRYHCIKNVAARSVTWQPRTDRG